MSSRSFNWRNSDFEMAKELALFYLGVLRRLVQGERVSRESLIRDHALKSHGVFLSEGTIKGLYHWTTSDDQKGPFFWMGLDGRISTWMTMKPEEALKKLDSMESDVERLSNPLDTIPRFGRARSGPERPRVAASRGRHGPELTEGIIPVDIEEPAGRKEMRLVRAIRDTKASAALKKVHGFSCQVCGKTMPIPRCGQYCEVHHIKPLGKKHGGPDTAANMLCLCPNHHAEMDYHAFYVDPETMRIVHHDASNAFNGKVLRYRKDHHVTARYLEYHRDVVCSDWVNTRDMH